MSRLSRLKTASHGDDGKWVYDEIVSLRKQRDELLSAIAKESAERDAVNTIAKRQSAILTRTGDELADCRVEIAALKAERDTRIAQLERQRDELLAALERFMDSNEECTDFDGFTARIVSMGDYHKLMEAVARAKGEQLWTLERLR